MNCFTSARACVPALTSWTGDGESIVEHLGGAARAIERLSRNNLAIVWPPDLLATARAFVVLKGVSGLTAHIRDPTRLSRREA